MNRESIIQILQTVENYLKSDIEAYFISIYPTGHLFSHGLEHHKRVWRNAKEILIRNGSLFINIDQLLIEQIMFACYFHDIGMAIDYGHKHGVSGSEKASEYLKSRQKNITDFRKTLEAIEYHDDKDYSSLHKDNIILRILSIADDIDAFGFIGIYRYIDIYIRRKEKTGSLGIMIRKNASSRFKNLNNSKILSPEFLKKHASRYNILDSFFEKYNKELSQYTFGTSSPSGHCGLIEIIGLCHDSQNETDFSNILLKYSNDSVIKWFHKGLTSELKKYQDSTELPAE